MKYLILSNEYYKCSSWINNKKIRTDLWILQSIIQNLLQNSELFLSKCLQHVRFKNIWRVSEGIFLRERRNVCIYKRNVTCRDHWWNASDDCGSNERVSTNGRADGHSPGSKARIIDSNFNDNPVRAAMAAITVTPWNTGIWWLS